MLWGFLMCPMDEKDEDGCSQTEMGDISNVSFAVCHVQLTRSSEDTGWGLDVDAEGRGLGLTMCNAEVAESLELGARVLEGLVPLARGRLRVVRRGLGQALGLGPVILAAHGWVRELQAHGVRTE